MDVTNDESEHGRRVMSLERSTRRTSKLDPQTSDRPKSYLKKQLCLIQRQVLLTFVSGKERV